MKDNVNGGHGLSSLNILIKWACAGDKSEGSCDLGKKFEDGTPQHRFGRLLNATDKANQPTEDKLRGLANSMLENNTEDKDGPADAGMAFLGQFIDHDLTLDATTELGQAAGDVTRVQNFRTPRLDLDCVYGNGPEVTPYLYHKNLKLIVGRRDGDVDDLDGKNDLDLQRNRNGTALIGDPRNDENLFVSQVQGRIFIEKHNEFWEKASGDDKHRYETARDALTHWYHQTIVEDFLPQVVDSSVLQPLVDGAKSGSLPNAGKLVWDYAPDMPVEFSAAAYRFGHSMIRQTYDLNDKEGRSNVSIFPDPNNPNPVKINGFSPIIADNNLDMHKFFGAGAQRSRAIDTHIPAALLKLPEAIVGSGEANLAFRNMSRGQLTFALPTGERMAEALGVTSIDSNDHIKDAELEGKTPLWYYILLEAEQNNGKLGAVGGTLVAGVILNLMMRGNSPYFPDGYKRVYA